jgi:hypothetical protein
MFECDAMHHWHAVDGRGEADRPAVEPHGRSVGKHNVTSCVLLGRTGAQGDSSVSQVPNGLIAVSPIDRVGPHKVTQFRTLEREPRPDLVQRHGNCLLGLERIGSLVVNLEHARNTFVGHSA